MADNTWHDRYKEARSAGAMVSDKVSKFVGSWFFVFLHVVWFGSWIAGNFEPFPFGLLTMIVSLEAILLSTFIMMSQNRQADRDRHQAEADYDTDVKAKKIVDELQTRLTRIENDKLDKILAILDKKGSG